METAPPALLGNGKPGGANPNGAVFTGVFAVFEGGHANPVVAAAGVEVGTRAELVAVFAGGHSCGLQGVATEVAAEVFTGVVAVFEGGHANPVVTAAGVERVELVDHCPWEVLFLLP
jgi:hypothetical protein